MAARHTLIATEFAFWRRGRTSSGIRCQSDVLLWIQTSLGFFRV